MTIFGGSFSTWKCAHHRCYECDRSATSIGGALYACECCPGAYCRDHFPKQATVIYDSAYFMSYITPGSKAPPALQKTCYIHCSEHCVRFAQEHLSGYALPPRMVTTPAKVALDHYFGKMVRARENLRKEAERRRNVYLNSRVDVSVGCMHLWLYRTWRSLWAHR